MVGRIALFVGAAVGGLGIHPLGAQDCGTCFIDWQLRKHAILPFAELMEWRYVHEEYTTPGDCPADHPSCESENDNDPALGLLTALALWQLEVGGSVSVELLGRVIDGASRVTLDAKRGVLRIGSCDGASVVASVPLPREAVARLVEAGPGRRSREAR